MVWTKRSICCVETYLEAGDEALIVVPTYSMYRIYMMAAGATGHQRCRGRRFRVSD